MSVAEMKLAAIDEITKINDENSLKELLAFLSNKSILTEAKQVNLFQHYETIKGKYGDVLEKLAQ